MNSPGGDKPQKIDNNMKAKRQILMLLLMMCSIISMNAQTSLHGEEAEKEEIRQKIGIDYTMPDFNTSKINGNVIGIHLAKMLRKLDDRACDYGWSSSIINICCEQNEKLSYAILEKFSIKNISKAGDVITIKANVKLQKNSTGIRNTDILMVFEKGVSASQAVNDLFSILSRYIKD
jgi:hypothetical protein